MHAGKCFTDRLGFKKLNGRTPLESNRYFERWHGTPLGSGSAQATSDRSEPRRARFASSSRAATPALVKLQIPYRESTSFRSRADSCGCDFLPKCPSRESPRFSKRSQVQHGT